MNLRIQMLLEQIVQNCSECFGDNLIGVYLHGSLAFGCFVWMHSDIDFIVVTRHPPSDIEKEVFISRLLLLDAECPPKGLEMSVVLEKHCRNFVHPCPYELHYSNAHRQSYLEDLPGTCARLCGTDRDLAAHFTVTRSVGIALCGKPVDEVFGAVPANDYFDSLLYDLENARADACEDPVRVILNLCRTLAWKRDGLILSKQQGADRVLLYLPEAYHLLIREAARCYRTGADFPSALLPAASDFADTVLREFFSR